jgi:hypothetical protein
MMIAGRPLPKDVTDKWPEVLSGIKINEVPLKYLQTVLINFKNDKVWEICITAQTRTGGWREFDKKMSELVQTYDNQIETVEFELNTTLLKKDVQLLTKKFLRKQKL